MKVDAPLYSFDAPEAGAAHGREVRIDAEEVRCKLAPLADNRDLSRFIL